MRKAALIYNPASGSRHHLRLAKVQEAARALEAGGVSATLIPTESAGSGGMQAVAAVAAGHDAIFACGGDGTSFDILQGLVAHAPDVPLGLVPLGTGNVLANDLGIPHDPAKAIAAQLRFRPRRIAAGQVEYQGRSGARESRYFTIMAGVGPDALMLYRVTSAAKQRYGIVAYLWEMVRLALNHPNESFSVDVATDCDAAPRTSKLLQVAAIRITNFGNFMRRFAPDAALTRDDFQAVLISTPDRFKAAAYMTGAWLGRRWEIEGFERLHCARLECRAHDLQAYRYGLYIQADGELLGTLPATIRMVPNAFTLLMPPSR
jgi:diacylglycerol kinase family enzyme